MNTFPDYRTATGAAYSLLAEMNEFALSTDVFGIIGRLKKCKLLTYGQAEALGYYSRQFLLCQSEHRFTLVRKSDNARIILYNETKPLATIRFTLAHEIGHAVLGHSDEKCPWQERESNCFARNLLCPIPVVDALQVETERDYILLFNVSESMASVAKNYNSSDRYYIDSELYNVILEKLNAYLHGYERVSEYYWNLA